jgi:hypothetical protein
MLEITGDRYNAPDEASGKDLETQRCLRRIWADRLCCAIGTKFDETNTIIIDNETCKVRGLSRQCDNAHLIEPYYYFD